jgi:hypothetical protein
MNIYDNTALDYDANVANASTYIFSSSDDDTTNIIDHYTDSLENATTASNLLTINNNPIPTTSSSDMRRLQIQHNRRAKRNAALAQLLSVTDEEESQSKLSKLINGTNGENLVSAAAPQEQLTGQDAAAESSNANMEVVEEIIPCTSLSALKFRPFNSPAAGSAQYKLLINSATSAFLQKSFVIPVQQLAAEKEQQQRMKKSKLQLA